MLNWIECNKYLNTYSHCRNTNPISAKTLSSRENQSQTRDHILETLSERYMVTIEGALKLETKLDPVVRRREGKGMRMRKESRKVYGRVGKISPNLKG